MISRLIRRLIQSEFGISLWSEKIPIIPQTFDYAAMGLVPAGAYNNMDFRKDMVNVSSSVKQAVIDIMYDHNIRYDYHKL